MANTEIASTPTDPFSYINEMLQNGEYRMPNNVALDILGIRTNNRNRNYVDNINSNFRNARIIQIRPLVNPVKDRQGRVSANLEIICEQSIANTRDGTSTTVRRSLTFYGEQGTNGEYVLQGPSLKIKEMMGKLTSGSAMPPETTIIANPSAPEITSPTSNGEAQNNQQETQEANVEKPNEAVDLLAAGNGLAGRAIPRFRSNPLLRPLSNEVGSTIVKFTETGNNRYSVTLRRQNGNIVQVPLNKERLESLLGNM